MWSFKATRAALLIAAIFVSGCTIEPLNKTQQDGAVSGNVLSGSTVNTVTTRVGQQVRNNLLFSMGNSQNRATGSYNIALITTSVVSNIAIEQSSIAPIAAKATVSVLYTMKDSTGKVVTSGKRSAFASFDKTPQSFANERAARDAENRAAKEVAQQIYLALAQAATR